MEMKLALEIMIPLDEYPCIQDTCTIKEAIEVMDKTYDLGSEHVGYPRALLVFDELKILVGILRHRDILKGLEPSFIVHEALDYRKKLWDVTIDPNLSELSGEKMVEGILEQSKRPVHDCMVPVRQWVDHTDHVMKAIYEMVDHGINIIPVLMGDKIVGVVRSVEAFKEAAKLVLDNG